MRSSSAFKLNHPGIAATGQQPQSQDPRKVENSPRSAEVNLPPGQATGGWPHTLSGGNIHKEKRPNHL